jgi:hypothetical protein
MRSFSLVVTALIPVAVAAPVAATAPLVGGWAVGFSALLLLVAVAAIVVGGPLWIRLAIVMGVLGGSVGVYSATAGLVAVGATWPYVSRIGFGAAALVLAVLAAASGGFMIDRPRSAAAVMAFSGLLGAVAINLFYINTAYVLAVPFWLLGAMLALVAPGRQLTRAQRGKSLSIEEGPADD